MLEGDAAKCRIRIYCGTLARYVQGRWTVAVKAGVQYVFYRSRRVIIYAPKQENGEMATRRTISLQGKSTR